MSVKTEVLAKLDAKISEAQAGVSALSSFKSEVESITEDQPADVVALQQELADAKAANVVANDKFSALKAEFEADEVADAATEQAHESKEAELQAKLDAKEAKLAALKALLDS